MKNKTAVWTTVILVGAYVAAQAIADVAATKMVTMWNITLPAGSIIFALTFTLRDLLHKRLGREWARAAIITAGLINVVQALYLSWMASMDAPPFYAFTDSWSAIFAIIPSITVGSIIAEVTSEWVDTEIYHVLYNRTTWPQWANVLGSNAVSLPLDSLVFGTMAFVVLPHLFGGEAMTIGHAMQIVAGQIVWKAVVTVVSMPLIYTVKPKSPGLLSD